MKEIDEQYNKIRALRYLIRGPCFKETWDKFPEDRPRIQQLINNLDIALIKEWLREKDNLGAKTHKELRVIALRLGFTGIKGFNKATLLSLIQETLDARRNLETSSGDEASDIDVGRNGEEIQQTYPRFISQVGHSD